MELLPRNRVFLIATYLLLFFACRDKQDIYYRLDHDQWFLYEKGDTLTFRNNDTTVDTYLIGDITNYFDSRGDDLNLHYEHLVIDYDMLDECNNCPIDGFRRTYFGIEFMGKIDFFNNFFNYENPTINYTLGDKLLQNVYVLDNIPMDSNESLIKAIFYSDIYGIIRYDMYNDKAYELQLE